jgi:hypothetical protein
MNFRVKCLAQHLFSVLPAGGHLNYLCQRYLTHTLPLSQRGFASRLQSTRRFYDLYVQYSAVSPTDSTCLDFSAGTHLQNPIGLSLLGLKKIITADVVRIARVALVRDVIRKYSRLAAATDSGFDLPEVSQIDSRNLAATLVGSLRISYLAPFPIQCIPLDEGSVDFVVSRTTLEHVPEADIPAIAHHCLRLLADDGIAVFSIDYRDHWSFFDSTISVYNFLRYSTNTWRRLNPPLHYQSRLRHVDYRTYFRDAGFSILLDEELPPTDEERTQLAALPIDETIRHRYADAELAATRGLFVMRKSSGSRAGPPTGESQ